MPDQQEELRLTVTLADNASAGLQKLNEEIKQLGSGASQQQVEKFKRETTDLTSKIKGMSSEVSEAFKGLGMLRSGLAAGAAGLSVFGFEMVRQIKALQEYTDKIRALNQTARQFGVDPAQLKDMSEQLAAVGVKSETAVASIAAMAGKIADLQRQGSQLRFDLMHNAGPDAEAQRNMALFIDRLTHATTIADRLNTVREAGEQVYRHALEQTHSEQEAANRRNSFWAKLGYDAQLANVKNLENLTAQEQRWGKERQENAEHYSTTLGLIADKWNGIVEMLQDPVLGRDSPLVKGLEQVDNFLGKILEEFKEVKKLNEELPAPEGFWQKLNPFNERNIERERRIAPGLHPEQQKRSTDENTEQLKQLNDQLRNMGGGWSPVGFQGGGVGGGGIIPAAFHPGGGGGGGIGGAGVSPRSFGGGGYANLGGSGGGGAPYGSDTGGDTGTGSPGPAGDPAVPSDILEKAKAVALHSGPGGVETFMRARGYPKAGNWCGEFAASVVRSAGGTPPKNPAIASNWRNWGTAVDTPQPGDVAVRRGARTGSTGSHVTFVEGVDPKTGRFTGLGGNQGRWQSQYPTSQFEFRRATGELPNGQTAGPGTGTGAGDAGLGGGADFLRQQRWPLTKQLDDDPQLKKQLAGLTSLEHESDATAVVESLYNRTTALNEARAKKGLPPLSLHQMMTGGFYGPANKGLVAGRVAQLERDPERMKKLMGGIDAASTSNLLKGATDQGSGHDPNVSWRGGRVVRDGEVYNDWGGGAGHEGNRAFRERQQASIAAADRAQLDRSQVATTKVEGSGKLSVNVNAPKGTNVGAEGSGLFKKVEINRQTQMSEAPRGPKGGYATEAMVQ